MKKYIFVVVLSIFCLTGCGEKTLTCTNVEQDDSYSMEENIIFKFDKNGEKIKSGSFDTTFKMSDDYVEYIDTMVEFVNSEFEDLKNVGIEPKIEKNNNEINVEIDYNVDKLTDEQLDELYFADLYYDEDFDTIKSNYEDFGYTCK